jgi:hypothetical protein
MDTYIYCLVDASGHVHVKDGASSHAEVAAAAGVDADACDTYRFDLVTRRLLVDRGSPAGDRAAHAYWDQHVGSPERLMAFAAQGRVDKQILGRLLDSSQGRAYLDACTVIERQYTAECGGAGDPCLASGCSLEGESCLEPLLKAGPEYQKACGAVWNTLFEDPRHRIQAWMH